MYTDGTDSLPGCRPDDRTILVVDTMIVSNTDNILVGRRHDDRIGLDVSVAIKTHGTMDVYNVGSGV